MNDHKLSDAIEPSDCIEKKCVIYYQLHAQLREKDERIKELERDMKYWFERAKQTPDVDLTKDAQLAKYKAALEKMRLVTDSIDAAESEGLQECIQEQNGPRLADLLERRILHHYPEARAALAEGDGK